MSNGPLILDGSRPTPGVNLDRIDVAAGVRELLLFWPEAPPETRMVVEHALMRWKRGEEAAAERGAIDRSFHGIDFGSWRRVLAAARAAAEVAAGVDVPDEAHLPHGHGPAVCDDCGHRWIAVWPLAADALECPKCHGTNTDREAK